MSRMLTRDLDLLTNGTSLLVCLRLLPIFHFPQLLEEQVCRLRRIDGFGERVVFDALLEDTNTIVVLADFVVRVFQGLGDLLVGVDVDVGLDDGGSEGDFASCQISGELTAWASGSDTASSSGLSAAAARALRLRASSAVMAESFMMGIKNGMKNKVVGIREGVLYGNEKKTCLLDANEAFYVSMAQYFL
ncbi:hypothetical protein Q7P35_003682 [Cladosporium inversicolor]